MLVQVLFPRVESPHAGSNGGLEVRERSHKSIDHLIVLRSRGLVHSLVDCPGSLVTAWMCFGMASSLCRSYLFSMKSLSNPELLMEEVGRLYRTIKIFMDYY